MREKRNLSRILSLNHPVYIQPQILLWQEGCVPGKVVSLKAFSTPTVGFYPTLSKKALSFPYVAGDSVPSQLQAFKFKTNQNNPFPWSIFVKNPTSPERSGSQNPESKCISASSAFLKLLGCSTEEAVLLWLLGEGKKPPGHQAIIPRPL